MRFVDLLFKNRKRPLISDTELRLQFAESEEILADCSRELRKSSRALTETLRDYEERNLHGAT